jgi:hypothetical protein
LLLEPLDPEVEDLALAYRYCKLFNCSVAEYEERPFRETMWLLKIDDTYQEASNELQEESQR